MTKNYCKFYVVYYNIKFNTCSTNTRYITSPRLKPTSSLLLCSFYYITVVNIYTVYIHFLIDILLGQDIYNRRMLWIKRIMYLNESIWKICLIIFCYILKRVFKSSIYDQEVIRIYVLFKYLMPTGNVLFQVVRENSSSIKFLEMSNRIFVESIPVLL